jgi:hypothetical protein
MNFSRIGKAFIAITVFALSVAGCGGGDYPDNIAGGSVLHSVSGKVNGAPASGVTIRLSGAVHLTTTSDSAGKYVFSKVTNGSYTITPILTGYTFSPASLTVTLNGANITNADFTATVIPAPTYGISGTVSGAVLQGVTITLTGATNTTTTTNANGNYSVGGLVNGNYTLTPTLTGYIFNPASTAVTISGSNVIGTNFTALANAAPTYGISGTVSGTVVQGVTITLTGAGNATTTTDAGGNYSFTGLVSGSYIITPSHTGCLFVTASSVVTLSNANVANVNFAAMAHAGPTYSILGTVSGVVQQGVTVNLSGTTCATTTTDASGNYSFTGLAAGSYTVAPMTWLACSYIATPKNAAVTINSTDVIGTDFTLAAGNPCGGSGVVVTMSNLSGTVSGAVQQGVTIILTGPICRTTTTDGSGNYMFSEYFNDGTYTMTPAMVGHTFSPTSTSIPFFGTNVTGKNFTAF